MKNVKTFNDIVKTNGKNFESIESLLSLSSKNIQEIDEQFNKIPYWIYLTHLVYGNKISSLFNTSFFARASIGFDARTWMVLNSRYGLDETPFKQIGDETLIDSIKFILYVCSKENILLDENEYNQWKQVGLSNNTKPVEELSARGLDKAIVMAQNINPSDYEREMEFNIKYLLMSFLKEVKNRKLESVINCDNNVFYKIFNKVIDDSKLSKNTAGYFPLLFTSFVDYKKDKNALSNTVDNFIKEKHNEMNSAQARYYKDGAAEKIFVSKIIDFFQGAWVTVKKLREPVFEKMFVNELNKSFLLLDDILISCENKTSGIQNSIKAEIDKFEAYFLRESDKREILKNVPRLSEHNEDFKFDNIVTSYTIDFEDEKWRNFQKKKYKKAVKGSTYSRLVESLEKLDTSNFLNIENTNVMSKDKKNKNGVVTTYCSVTITNDKNEEDNMFKAKVAAAFELFIKMNQGDFDPEIYTSMEEHLMMKFDVVSAPKKKKTGVKF